MVLPVTDHGTNPHKRVVRPKHARLAIPLGGGLDRDSGKYFTDRGMTRDLRNLLLRGGTAHVRYGMGEGVAVPNATDILGIKFLPYEGMLILATYNRDTREIHVYKANGTGEGPEIFHVGLWFTLDPSIEELPIVVMAETYQKVFMAHDEADLGVRAPTFVYDPLGQMKTGGFLGPLEADWAQQDGLIRFRGVVSYMDYLIGWGFGTNSDHRPEMVRTSLPGLPVRPEGTAGFEDAHWMTAGSRGSPVVACAPAGPGMLILKENETYPLLGTSPRTFGVGPAVDQKFGLVGPNLWTNLNGVLYVWSHEGPRFTAGGALEDLAIPLDLDGPSPDELAEVERSGFATYIPETRVILFVFGQWAYALDVRTGVGGWTYWEIGYPMRAAEVGQKIEGVGIRSPVAGPFYHSLHETTSSSLKLVVENIDNNGSEMIETWIRNVDLNGPWEQVPSATARALIDDTQIIHIKDLFSDTLYEVAFRYVIGGLYHADYPTVHPGLWPHDSRVQVPTLPPEPLTAVWERLTHTEEQVTVSFDVPEGEAPEVERAVYKSVDDGETWELVEEGIVGANQYIYTLPEDESESEIYMKFQVRVGIEPSGAEVEVWTGYPHMPIGIYRWQNTWVDQDETRPPHLSYEQYWTGLYANMIFWIYSRIPGGVPPDARIGIQVEWEEYPAMAVGTDGTIKVDPNTGEPYPPNEVFEASEDTIQVAGYQSDTRLWVEEDIGWGRFQNFYYPPNPNTDAPRNGWYYRGRTRVVFVTGDALSLSNWLDGIRVNSKLDFSDWSPWSKAILASVQGYEDDADVPVEPEDPENPGGPGDEDPPEEQEE